jgi:hypothetical protein
MVAMPQFRILRSKNSLLFIENKKDGTANGTFFFADPMEVRDDIFIDCMKSMKAGKFNKVLFSERTNEIDTFAKKAKLHAVAQHDGSNFNTTVSL